MKKRIMKLLLATTLTLLMTISPGWSAGAGSCASFWVQFQASVAKGDKEAIAGMTKFPFAYGGRLLSKGDFIKAYGEIFSGTKCLAKAKPVKADDRESFSVFCGSLIYVFEKVNGEYKFTDTGEND